jgi:hypothetical protein
VRAVGCYADTVAGEPLAILGEIVPHDGRLWRLDFLGAVFRAHNRVTPMVELSLTPYKPPIQSRKILESQSSYDYDRSVNAAAAVSDFGFLRVGSFWIGGVPHRRFPNYERREFTVDVSRSSTSFYRAYHNADRRFLIPPFVYRIPFSDSRLVALPTVEPISTLLIPCSEVFRFYYCGASGKFGTAILDGTYLTRRSKIVNQRASSWPDADGVAVLRRGEYVNDDDVVEIARTTFSSYAREEADFIFTSMAGAGCKSQIQARLPFEARAQLVVRGIAFAGPLGPTFLAFVIESCTGPMPFQHLIFERDNEPNPDRAEALSASQRNVGTLRAPPTQPPVSVSYTQQSDPNSEERATMLSGLLSAHRYKTEYDVKHRARDAVTTGGRGTRREEEIEAPYASGTRVGDAGAHPAEFTLGKEERGQPPELEDFWHAIDELKARRRDIEVRRIETYSFPVGSAAKGQASRRRTWPFIDGRKRKIRRHAAIAIALTAAEAHVLIEIERRPCQNGEEHEYFQTIIVTGGRTPSLARSDVQELLAYLVTCRGTVSRGSSPVLIGGRHWRVDGLRHSGDPKDSVARAEALARKVVPH